MYLQHIAKFGDLVAPLYVNYVHIDTGNKATTVAHTHLTNCALLVAPANRDELTYCSSDAQFHSVA